MMATTRVPFGDVSNKENEAPLVAMKVKTSVPQPLTQVPPVQEAPSQQVRDNCSKAI